MGNLRKQQRKEFEKFASKLPPFLINSTETHILKGSELLEWGFTMDPLDETKKIDPDKKYVYKQPVQTLVNHVRRMHKAFDTYGPEGVNEYLLQLSKKLNATAEIKEEQKPEAQTEVPDVEPEQPAVEKPKSFMQRLSNVLHGD